jgi:hypothetical protein
MNKDNLSKFERFDAALPVMAAMLAEQPVLMQMIANMYPTMDLTSPGAQAMFN